MVFPSVPLYLDHPTSWNEHQHQLVHQQQPIGGGGGGGGNGDPQQQSQLQPVPAQPPPRPHGGSGSGMGSIRPNSMADRARLAKIPQPEQALKCPRCDSTNTKFCYFNNYSLSQPRHFCKTCRRYWTRGGALRNVPVGGGCRRNKRSSKSGGGGGGSSKSSSAATTAENRQPGAGSSSSSATSAGTSTLPAALPPPQLPFLGSLQPMMDYGVVPNIGLGFSGMQQSMDRHHHSVDNMGLEQWRLSQIQQFPFLGGLESQLPAAGVPGMYPFDGQGSGGGAAGAPTESELITQLASVKMKDNHPGGLNLAGQYLGVSTPRNVQFWAGGGGGGGNGGEGSSAAAGGSDVGGGGWMTNLSGFNSSSTGSLL